MSSARFAVTWRSFAAASCFAAFSLLAAGAAPTALVAIILTTRDSTVRARRIKHLVSFGFRLLLRWAEALKLFQFATEGTEWISAAPGRLLVANHPCFLDAIVLLAQLPDANCVVKGKLRHHPLFAPYLHVGRYVVSSAAADEVIAECGAAAARGEAILIFPEGTRSRPGTMLRFRRGAAQIALRTGMEILPVTVFCDPLVLTHGTPWFRMPASKVRHEVRFHHPCKPSDFASINGIDIARAARQVTQGMQNYFSRELSLPEVAHVHHDFLGTSLERSPS